MNLRQAYPNHKGKITFISPSSLGGGSYGAVYKGLREGQLVAIKKLTALTRELERLPVVRPRASRGSALYLCWLSVKRLAREFLSMRELSHPNILPLIAVSVGLGVKDPSYMIFPWASNGNTRTYVNGKSFETRMRIVSTDYPQSNVDTKYNRRFQISECFAGLLYRS